MDHARHFVGRREEIRRFNEVLADPRGQVVMIVGPEGIGKSSLAWKMVESVKPPIEARRISLELTQNDSMDVVLERLLQDVEGAVDEKSSLGTEKRRQQWRALLELAPKGKEVANLLAVLRPSRDVLPREKFLHVLEVLSGRLAEHQRAIFLLDPIRYLPEDCADDWYWLMQQMPERVIFLFPQRPDDALADSAKFRRLRHLVRLPRKPLGRLEESAVDEFLGLAQLTERRASFAKFDGHPYALSAAIDLVIDEDEDPDALPSDPSEVSASQWSTLSRQHPAAIPLFQAYAVLEVRCPPRWCAR